MTVVPAREAVPAAPEPAAIFAALGDQTRLALLTRLGDGEARSISALASSTDITRQAVTKHLRVMEEVGLISSVRSGRENRFAVRREGLDAARDYLATVSAQWDAALARLRSLVEE